MGCNIPIMMILMVSMMMVTMMVAMTMTNICEKRGKCGRWQELPCASGQEALQTIYICWWWWWWMVTMVMMIRGKTSRQSVSATNLFLTFVSLNFKVLKSISAFYPILDIIGSRTVRRIWLVHFLNLSSQFQPNVKVEIVCRRLFLAATDNGHEGEIPFTSTHIYIYM